MTLKKKKNQKQELTTKKEEQKNINPPKYKVGTLVLSNIPYNVPDGTQELGYIVYVYEKDALFIKNRYIVEWTDRWEHLSTYSEEEIEILINNLQNYMSS